MERSLRRYSWSILAVENGLGEEQQEDEEGYGEEV